MKLSNTYIFWQVAVAAVLLALSGCSSDVPDDASGIAEGIPTEVTFSISARPNALTRGDGNLESPTEEGEKICDWFAVFVDKDNKVRKILHRSDLETQITDVAAAVEEERFKCIIPSGTYTIYAFANMSDADLAAASGLTFTLDGEINPTDIASKTWTRNLNLLDIDKDKIPMSGCLKDVKIENVIEETFSIEVVRMAAKIELIFTNPDEKPVSINSIGIDPVTTSVISLFPRSTTGSVTGISYSHLGNSAYEPFEGATYGKITYKPTDAISVTKSAPQNAVFYIQESISDYKNEGSFTITLNVTHEDGAESVEQHNITRDISGYINRNDWIRIPVTLSQYDVSVEAIFYPPIGGYPAVLSSEDPDGAQVFTFGTEGDFSIVPKVIDKITGRHLLPAEYEMRLVSLMGDAIFATGKTPALTSTPSSIPDEITGTLSSASGRAIVTINVIIGSHTYTRTIYIIRDNNINNN